MPLFTSAKHKAVTSQRQPPQAASLPASENREKRAYAALAQQAVDKSKTNAACRCCCPKTNWRVNSWVPKAFCSQKSQKASANRRRRSLTIHQRSRGGRSLRFGLSSVFSTLRRCRRANKKRTKQICSTYAICSVSKRVRCQLKKTLCSVV